jgi:hypothetical protein
VRKDASEGTASGIAASEAAFASHGGDLAYQKGSQSLSPDSALDATRRSSLAFIAANAGQDVSAYRFPHPIFGSLNLYDWYRFIGYHELRHRKQICELVEIFHR